MPYDWYEKKHRKNETPEFVGWFEGKEMYGVESDYSNEEDAIQEYWIRRAFALMGWNARGKQILPSSDDIGPLSHWDD